jgi:type IV fimbrial biogenesis protein FimT
MRLHLRRGFTLIELLVTLTVAGILFSIGVPAFSSFLKNDRDLGQINSLVSSFNYARSEAVKRASPFGITVCASLDGVNCDLAATTWSEGWIVTYIDTVTPANSVVLQTVPALDASNTVTPIGLSPAGITFFSSGLASAALTIRVCDSRGATFARQIEVLSTGRVASTQTHGQSVNGTALTCP